MISVDLTIQRFRRDLTVASLLRSILVGSAIVCVLFGPLFGPHAPVATILTVIAIIWLVLSYRSVRGSQAAAGSSSLIARGQWEQAEQQIEHSLRSFSLFRTAKLMSLHHLALLRHAQRRWQEAAVLCHTLLHQRLGPLHNLAKPSRLILAESLLEMDDLRGAYDALKELYGYRLSLGEAMRLLQVQLDYLARIGAWEQVLDQMPAKLELAELMPSNAAARVQAVMAMAARKLNRGEWADFLRRRVELLADVQQLAKERPWLWELWSAGMIAPAPAAEQHGG